MNNASRHPYGSTPRETALPRKKKVKGKKRRSILGTVLLAFLLLALLLAGMVSAGVAWYIIRISEDLPTMVDVANPKSSIASVLYDRNNKVIARLFIENRTPLQLHQISPWLIKAILAAEDSSFYQHSGIRIGSILRANYQIGRASCRERV